MKTPRWSAVLGFSFITLAQAAEPDFQSEFLSIGFSRGAPAFSVFAVDSLGQGKVRQNPVLEETNAVAVRGLELAGRFTYKLNGQPVWSIICGFIRRVYSWSRELLSSRHL